MIAITYTLLGSNCSQNHDTQTQINMTVLSHQPLTELFAATVAEPQLGTECVDNVQSDRRRSPITGSSSFDCSFSDWNSIYRHHTIMIYSCEQSTIWTMHSCTRNMSYNTNPCTGSLSYFYITISKRIRQLSTEMWHPAALYSKCCFITLQTIGLTCREDTCRYFVTIRQSMYKAVTKFSHGGMIWISAVVTNTHYT